jgi:hypothetical protein
MKFLVIGAHLLRDDVEPVAEALPAGDLFVSALAIEDDQPLGDRELLLRIAGIRAKLLDVATFVAIRYGFTVAGAEEAQWKCASHIAKWRDVLTANRGNVEMTLKVAAAAPRARPDRHEFTNGAEYLRALHEAKRSASVDPLFREAAEELFLPLARNHRWLQRDEKSVEFTALVPREELDAMRAAGEALRERAPGVPFLLSGPWPLEVFGDDDHE